MQSTYGAGNQNWMISQDENYVFFANNEGLLEYNGSNWELYPSQMRQYTFCIGIVNCILVATWNLVIGQTKQW
jgi:hypothetical protein